MLSISNEFFISEGLFNWAKSSISNLLGRRPLNKIIRSQLTPVDKIVSSERSHRRLTPRPKKVELGFKAIRSYRRPANLI